MDWIKKLRTLHATHRRLHEQEREEWRKGFKKRHKMTWRRNVLRQEQRDLSARLRMLDRVPGSDAERQRVTARLAAIRTELRDIEIRRHLHGFHDEDAMFDRYYRHIRLSRPFILALNVALWFLLFWFGGASTGLKILVSFLAVATTAGTVYEILFLLRVKERILLPVDRLRKGVRAITEGTYEITVENESASEVSGLIDSFNLMAQKLKENERLKTEYEKNRKALISNISHDLKTPITSIQGYLEALQIDENLPDEKRARYLKIIQSNSAYMNRLIDDLFLFSTLDMEKMDFCFAQISIRPFLSDMMEEFRLDLEERGVSFQYEDALVQDYTVNLDAKRFHQILQNLIGNAIKHGPAQGLRVKVTACVTESELRLEVRDNGPGIPTEALPHLFERFYRVDSERKKDFSSTGLGLAIAKELAQAHGGDIAVSSEKGKGCCFTVTMSCKQEHTADMPGGQTK